MNYPNLTGNAINIFSVEDGHRPLWYITMRKEG